MKLALAVALACAASWRPVFADTVVNRPEGIEIDRDAPPPGRVEFGFDAGAPVGAWALGAQLGYVDRPIVLHDADVSIAPVRHRETLALGGALAIGQSVVVDARVPLAHQVGDRLRGLGDDAALEHFVLGDITVGARLRVAGDDRTGAFLRGQLALPTGDDFQFAGDVRWSAAWLLAGRATIADRVVLGATAGIRIRAAEVEVADRLVGDELVFGAGAAVALPPIAGLWCVPDQLRATAEIVGVIGDHIGMQRGPSPVEARLGVVGRPRGGLAIGVRAGIGLDDQVGSPRFRVMLEAAWQAPAQPHRTIASEPDSDDDE